VNTRCLRRMPGRRVTACRASCCTTTPLTVPAPHLIHCLPAGYGYRRTHVALVTAVTCHRLLRRRYTFRYPSATSRFRLCHPPVLPYRHTFFFCSRATPLPLPCGPLVRCSCRHYLLALPPCPARTLRVAALQAIRLHTLLERLHLPRITLPFACCPDARATAAAFCAFTAAQPAGQNAAVLYGYGFAVHHFLLRLSASQQLRFPPGCSATFYRYFTYLPRTVYSPLRRGCVRTCCSTDHTLRDVASVHLPCYHPRLVYLPTDGLRVTTCTITTFSTTTCLVWFGFPILVLRFLSGFVSVTHIYYRIHLPTILTVHYFISPPHTTTCTVTHTYGSFLHTPHLPAAHTHTHHCLSATTHYTVHYHHYLFTPPFLRFLHLPAMRFWYAFSCTVGSAFAYVTCCLLRCRDTCRACRYLCCARGYASIHRVLVAVPHRYGSSTLHVRNCPPGCRSAPAFRVLLPTFYLTSLHCTVAFTGLPIQRYLRFPLTHRVTASTGEPAVLLPGRRIRYIPTTPLPLPLITAIHACAYTGSHTHWLLRLPAWPVRCSALYRLH